MTELGNKIGIKTGKYYENNTQYYWKPLSEMFLDYMNHKEDKYDGDIGTLSRKKIKVDSVIHIGKRSNNLDESEIIGVSDNDYVMYDNASNYKITVSSSIECYFRSIFLF